MEYGEKSRGIGKITGYRGKIMEFKEKSNCIKDSVYIDNVAGWYDILYERKYKNIIDRETNIFANMLEVVHLWNSQLGKLDNITRYLRYNCMVNLNLRNTDLSEADLSETIFEEKQISMLQQKCDLSQSRVVISETNEIISYRDYCTRKQK